jgi:hypothetical protein
LHPRPRRSTASRKPSRATPTRTAPRPDV